MGHGETGGSLAAPVVRDFLMEALKDVPAVPFRAPAGMKLVRVNHKSGQPAGAGDRTRHRGGVQARSGTCRLGRRRR